MEKLLNKLIEKGWKPFWNEFTRVYVLRDSINKWDFALHFEYKQDRTTFRGRRQLVSKESWLWQFVCENDLIDNPAECWYWRNYFELDEIEFNQTDFQYWILESALCDEDKLEDFILDNVKIWND